MTLIEKMDNSLFELYSKISNKISEKTNLSSEQITDYTYGISASSYICAAANSNSALGTLLLGSISLVPTFKTMNTTYRYKRQKIENELEPIKLINIMLQSAAIYFTAQDISLATGNYLIGYENEAMEYAIRRVPENLGLITLIAGTYFEKIKN